MAKKIVNIFAQFQVFEKHIEHLEERLLQLEQKIDLQLQIERSHIIRVKNHEDLSDEFLSNGRKYQDLSPEKSWNLYTDKDYDFILVDVSTKGYIPPFMLPEANKIPWEELQERFIEIKSRTTPILIISEDGTKSVLACEFLVKRGFFNCNNISGGYKFWKGPEKTNVRIA
jgi:rhodanese-related sulfurtransferase